jgi:ADP-heptose:LPS heptosyltransferase
MDPSPPPSTPSPEPRTPNRPNRLVVRLANAVGDIIMARPALELLIEQGFSLVAVAPAFAEPLLRGLELDYRPLPKGLDGYTRLQGETGPYALTLRSSFRSSRELQKAGFRVIGFRTDLRGLLLWRSMRRPRGRHKSEEYFRLATYAAHELTQQKGYLEPLLRPRLDPDARAGFPRFQPSQEAQREAHQILAQAEVSPPYVLCCPTVAGHHPPGFKIWPEWRDFYASLAERGITTVTCPGPGEEERCRALAGGEILVGTSLDQLAAIAQNAAVVVSNDTGTMHLAAATGVATIGLFGDTGPTRYAPRSERAIALGELGTWPDRDEVERRVLERVQEHAV